MSISRKELLEFTNKFADKSGSILQKNYLKNFDIQKKIGRILRHEYRQRN